MASFTMDGKVKMVMDEQSFPSGFTKREFVVTSKDDRYPQDIKFEATKDRIEMLNGVAEGDEVSVTFDLRGNEYNGKYFVNLTAWKLEKVSGAATAGAAMPEDSAEDQYLQQEEDDASTPF